MKVFVDTNVLLDVLVERKDFYADAMRIWTLAESGRLDAFVSVISFSDCYDIIRKLAGRRNAEKSIRLPRNVFTSVDLTAQILNQAIDADFADFEDAIQFYSAMHTEDVCVITRNPDHFPRSPLSVLSPAEFLAANSFE